MRNCPLRPAGVTGAKYDGAFTYGDFNRQRGELNSQYMKSIRPLHRALAIQEQARRTKGPRRPKQQGTSLRMRWPNQFTNRNTSFGGAASVAICELDNWRAANLLIKRHGEDAAIIAAQRHRAFFDGCPSVPTPRCESKMWRPMSSRHISPLDLDERMTSVRLTLALAAHAVGRRATKKAGVRTAPCTGGYVRA